MHIGVIPDGNRRFMKKKGIPNLGASYEMGINKFYDVLDWCLDLGVHEITAYALSTENLQNRGALEIKTLLTLFSRQAESMLESERIHKKKVRINICGDADYLLSAGGKDLGGKLLANLKNLENATRNYKSVSLNLAIAYGGRQEIIHAANKAASFGLPITEENIRKNLWVKRDPELIIRTSERRLSNFLVWQSAYSEIYFVEKLWQEFNKSDLESILSDYRSKERRFGK
jgi:tritrans,polycis-undecaprenyl-diphosphate synthase [geranylgeranyl-diphosphate specific]